MKLFLTLALLAGSTLFAQGPFSGGFPFGNGQAGGVPAELRTYLNLTDSQAAQIQQVNRTVFQGLQGTFRQIGQQQQALDTLIKTPGATPQAIGQAVLDLQALRQSVAQVQAQGRTAVNAILNTEQRNRLQTLTQAQQLRELVAQAEAVHLLERPETPAGPPFGASRPGNSPFGNFFND